MRVRFESPLGSGKFRVGTLIGIVSEKEDCDAQVVVRVDGCGICCEVMHPSKVSPMEEHHMLSCAWNRGEECNCG